MYRSFNGRNPDVLTGPLKFSEAKPCNQSGAIVRVHCPPEHKTHASGSQSLCLS